MKRKSCCLLKCLLFIIVKHQADSNYNVSQRTLCWPKKIFKLIESDVRYLDQMKLKGKGFVSKHFPYYSTKWSRKFTRFCINEIFNKETKQADNTRIHVSSISLNIDIII